jgi:dephospho-CoA kinase
MLRVGLSRALASSKTGVGHTPADLGCRLIKADDLAHQVLLPGAEAYSEVLHEFGNGILDPDGSINRKKLGEVVFGHPELLEKLSKIVHPLVGARQKRMIEEIVQADPQAIIVVEAAILVETGSYKKCDRLIVAVCSDEQQMERAMRRGAYTREEVLARLSSQLPLEEKLKLADYVIDTSGTKEHTIEQVRVVYASLRSLSV